MLKNLLIAIHDVGQWLLHVILIPVLIGLKALDTGIQHLINELSKV